MLAKYSLTTAYIVIFPLAPATQIQGRLSDSDESIDE